MRQRRAVGRAAGHLREVAAGAERLALAGEDDGADVVVGVRVVERVEQLVDHLRPDRVAALRVVQRDGEHAVAIGDLIFAYSRVGGFVFEDIASAVVSGRGDGAGAAFAMGLN